MAYDEAGLRSATELAAWAVAGIGIAVLGLAVAAEILRRVRSDSPLLAVADRLLPGASRRVAVGVLTVLSTFVALAGPPDAGADGHIGRWLDGATTTTTTTAASTATTTPAAPDAADGHVDGHVDARAPRPDGRAGPPDAVAPTDPTTTTRAGATDVAPAPPVPAPVVAPPTAPVVTPPTAPVQLGPVAVVEAYTVVPGDCLWDIARRRLGPRATDAAVDRGWRAIYAANVAAVGSDPNLIRPGLVLALPPLDPTP